MRAGRMKRFATVIAAGMVAIACAGPNGPGRTPGPPPSAPPSSAPLPPSSPLAGLVGSYTVAIDLAKECTELPEAVKLRKYQLVLKGPHRGFGGQSFLSIVEATGGGLSEPTTMGDFWSSGLLRWNTNELGQCDGSVDGVPESLPDGGRVIICASGIMPLGDSPVSAAIAGTARIEDSDSKVRSCSGMHRFVFTRSSDVRHASRQFLP